MKKNGTEKSSVDLISTFKSTGLKNNQKNYFICFLYQIVIVLVSN
jgi:hypothetical protein